ncbi:PREDICTED: zinc finger CCCH domain-containing protein 13 isoform X1 [Lupinus angustifolius]|uniref:zinc finger CCCH domain-containing protein 13 isoform X1 n=1 Tax=Lupinus angustifolius TaxID=3871 RepID=UPI00092F468C|nr:PREDICTED: zinc finger CCCH domain-containing protein 13 isoform X1 [Lupinus angustifolius]XP_019453761.1 PREDICTED: zinc finger CCCH domain-containing protein 13 isoform X1 [Lupinus angustifolius]
MVERKQFKTRLCVLYQKGRCNRNNCSFAHGNVELRRFSASSSGRREYSGNDLRDKLDRRHLSPPRRYSPARDGRGGQATHGYSPSRSSEKKSDRRHIRKQGTTGQHDNPGSLNFSDRIQDQVRGKLFTSGSRNTLDEQLKKVESDINTLQNQKFQLEVYLDESVQEVDSLNSTIQELDAQLCKEKEECRRITSRIRQFIRVHHHNSQLQDELQRSQVRLQRFGDELVSDISRIGASEEDLSIDIVSNGENPALPLAIKHNVDQNDASPHRKRLHVKQDAVEELKQDRSKIGNLVGTSRTRKRSRWNLPAQLNDKDEENIDVPPNTGTEVTRTVNYEGKHKRGICNSSNNLISEKFKESRIEVPPTSMAAHVIDEEIEIELNDRTDITETVKTQNENGVAHEAKSLLLMLRPPLIPRTNYSRVSSSSWYEGDDENVDVDGLDEEDAGAHVDIV